LCGIQVAIMAREGLLTKCPQELHWLTLLLSDAAIEIDIHAKLLTTLMGSGQLGKEGVQKVHDDLIRLYIPDHKNTEEAETERLMKIYDSTPAVMRVDAGGEAIKEEFSLGG